MQSPVVQGAHKQERQRGWLVCVWVCFIHCQEETDVEERGRRRRENLPRGFYWAERIREGPGG